tara:strand:- start:151 stop:573 length:423 start_codon:yes stop_codon:yes gene_type:complete
MNFLKQLMSNLGMEQAMERFGMQQAVALGAGAAMLVGSFLPFVGAGEYSENFWNGALIIVPIFGIINMVLNFLKLTKIANLTLIVPVLVILYAIFLKDAGGGAMGFEYFNYAGAGFYLVMGAIVGALSPSVIGLIAKFKK